MKFRLLRETSEGSNTLPGYLQGRNVFHLTSKAGWDSIQRDGMIKINAPRRYTRDWFIDWVGEIYNGVMPIFVSLDKPWSKGGNSDDVLLQIDLTKISSKNILADIPSMADYGYILERESVWIEDVNLEKIQKVYDEYGDDVLEIDMESLIGPFRFADYRDVAIAITKTLAINTNIPISAVKRIK